MSWAVEHLFSSLTVAKGRVVSMTTSAHSFPLFMVALLGILEVCTSVPSSEVLTDLLSMNSSMCFLSKKISASVVSSGNSS